jgi:hypothetical protein
MPDAGGDARGRDRLQLLLDVAEPDWKARLFTDDDFLLAAVERAVVARP